MKVPRNALDKCSKEVKETWAASYDGNHFYSGDNIQFVCYRYGNSWRLEARSTPGPGKHLCVLVQGDIPDQDIDTLLRMAHARSAAWFREQAEEYAALLTPKGEAASVWERLDSV